MGYKKFFVLIKEVGLSWIICRCIYFAKIKILTKIPSLEWVWEKKRRYPVSLDLFDIDVKKIEDYLKGLDLDEKNQILSIANDAMYGKVHTFGGTVMDYGYPVKWNYNPLTGASYSLDKKWFEIPDFDKYYGDIKAVWELNRFTHVWYFTRAYLLTHDRQYFEAYKNQINAWVKENRYSFGPNYKCGQECSLRMINVLIAYSVFEKYGLIDNQFCQTIKNFIGDNYQKVRSNFFYARRCVKIDHLISELCGQIIGAYSCNKLIDVKKYFKMLDDEVIEQFNENGMYCSYSLNYQRYVMQLLELMLKFSKKCGYIFSEQAHIRLFNAGKLYLWLDKNVGGIPNYGANDGTLIFPLSSYEDYTTTAKTILSILSDQMNLNVEETLWMDCKIDALKFHKTTGQDDAFLLLKNKNMCMILNSHSYERRPGHMDQMHVDFWIEQYNVFCDLGSYSYAEELGDVLRKTSGHNTIKVKEIEQMNTLGKFLVYGKPEIIKNRRNDDYVEAIQKYCTGYIHSRTIYKTDFGFEIRDFVEGKCDKISYSVLFHTPYKVEVLSNNRCTITINNEYKVNMVGDGVEIALNNSCRSKRYLDKEDITEIELISTKNHHITRIEVLKCAVSQE